MKLKSHFNLKSITVAAFAGIALLFVVFVTYMIVWKDNTVFAARDIASYQTVENYSVEEIEDASAPIGVRKEYSWQIQQIDSNESCLMFYIVHSYAQVRLDGETVYSLTQGKNTRIGNSPGSNWVVVPLYQSDAGKEVTVTVTPVYTSVQNREVLFQIGARYAVFMLRLTKDLPQILLASLCMVMGITIILIQLCLVEAKRTSSYGMLYLGMFSLLVGIWRFTDTRFSPIMFSDYAAALGYITLSALFLSPIPLMLYLDERHTTGKWRFLLPSVVLANCATAFVALVCQVTGVADLRQTLWMCHIMLIVDVAAVVFISFADARGKGRWRRAILFVFLLVLGCILDLGSYYIMQNSSNNFFTSAAFILYVLYLSVENILSLNKKAYIDSKTRFYNKARWDSFIKEKIPANEPIGVMMLDLNRLKYVNDTFGHDAGDQMIQRFSRILRDTFATSEFLCRWGGDEFAIIIRNADRKKMEHYDLAVHQAVEAYNRSGAKPKIYFACGYVLSTEHPDVPRGELLAKADVLMYCDKQKWYNVHCAKD